ncbi:MAG: UDP-N-acetylglucosamine 1-carboxyvinyltransferase [Eubacteriales bacterium]|nr:UDP-N-acetylglucosamine 1-carboxyvinyltransferase [Eubacteriales bacterium]MDD4324578.1 UDP-N-acetylglucosamine 1-carboxyvinyltransferase [Eubacteriales bacterium]MDD4540814.1 UDP-N-acetylglucosamine 1-carboxyvinyltransferase [Eubacteriales bacterium]
MRTYHIEGGHRLAGDVPIGGSKNAALAIIAAAMVVDGPSVIENLPEVRDIDTLLKICSDLGAKVERQNSTCVRIDPSSINTHEAMQPLMESIRGSYYLMGALLGRFKKVKLRMPGGCDFGSRPIDLHLKGFQALGARTEVAHGNVSCEADQLVGGSVFLDTVSVGATVNIILAAVKAEGKTVIDNAAREPHIVDLANFLNTMGADIRGAGTDVIRIEGRPYLPANQEYAIIPDQIEAGTYMMLAPLTGGDIKVCGVIPKHMEPLTAKLKEMGAKVEEGEEYIRVTHNNGKKLKATSFKTMPYPGFPTDLQPQAVVLQCVADGTGRMLENVWENRYQYVDNLRMMGANILTSGKLAVIQGGAKLTGARVKARDLRAGAAMVMAALAAEGTSVVEEVEKIERGYEFFIDKMRNIGAKIKVVENNS